MLLINQTIKNRWEGCVYIYNKYFVYFNLPLNGQKRIWWSVTNKKDTGCKCDPRQFPSIFIALQQFSHIEHCIRYKGTCLRSDKSDVIRIILQFAVWIIQYGSRAVLLIRLLRFAYHRTRICELYDYWPMSWVYYILMVYFWGLENLLVMTLVHAHFALTPERLQDMLTLQYKVLSGMAVSFSDIHLIFAYNQLSGYKLHKPNKIYLSRADSYVEFK